MDEGVEPISWDSKQISLQYIFAEEDALRVTSFGPLAETTIKTFETLPINRSYLKSKTSEIMGLLRRTAAQGSAADDVQNLERMKALGQDLYRELIPESLKDKLDAVAGGDLLIYMDQRLVQLPWELLFDGQAFFCRRYCLGRFVNTPPSNKRIKKRRPQCPVKFLSISDPEGNLPAAQAESLQIKNRMLPLGGVTESIFLTHKVSKADFFENLARSDILHFAGHVTGERASAQIRFHDGALSCSQIERMAGRYPFPSLVFLNGCRSSVMSEGGPSPDAGQTRAYDLASSFLFCGTRHFIGPLWEIHDAVAALAGTVFFETILSGNSVGSALGAAREQLLGTFGELSMVWAGYVLYGDPGFRIQGLPAAVDRLFDEIMRNRDGHHTCLGALASGDPRTRFVAALALLQMGDETGLSWIEKQFDLIYDFLKSPSLQVRRQGELLLPILTGSSLGYRSDGDQAARLDAIESLRRWRESEAAETRFNPQ
ncbi:MAG: CHAT domain-containing protein [Planctomycetes bacterium]|nr:CHAT domain-containing protein [Planctomycetota bacterium]